MLFLKSAEEFQKDFRLEIDQIPIFIFLSVAVAIAELGVVGQHEHEDKGPGVVGAEVLVGDESVIEVFIRGNFVVFLHFDVVVEFFDEGWGHEHSGVRGRVGEINMEFIN